MTYKAVRTERVKLIHWVNREGVDELYDLVADPSELDNLIDDPARAGERGDAASRAGPPGRGGAGALSPLSVPSPRARPGS